MKILSIRQPWAEMIRLGLKDIENRSWKTKYRGRVAIHASSRLQRASYEHAVRMIEQIDASIVVPPMETLQTGGIIAFATLTGIEPIRESGSNWHDHGFYGWRFTDVQPVPFVDHKGGLSLRDLPPDIERLATWERHDRTIRVNLQDSPLQYLSIEQINRLTDAQAALLEDYAIAHQLHQTQDFHLYPEGRIVPQMPPVEAWLKAVK